MVSSQNGQYRRSDAPQDSRYASFSSARDQVASQPKVGDVRLARLTRQKRMEQRPYHGESTVNSDFDSGPAPAPGQVLEHDDSWKFPAEMPLYAEQLEKDSSQRVQPTQYAHTASPVTQKRETLGEFLRQRRLAYSLSLEDISEKLRIKVSYLKAIEEGSYQDLPAEIYVQGFVNAYATALGLSGSVALELYKKEMSDHLYEEKQLEGREGRPFSALFAKKERATLGNSFPAEKLPYASSWVGRLGLLIIIALGVFLLIQSIYFKQSESDLFVADSEEKEQPIASVGTSSWSRTDDSDRVASNNRIQGNAQRSREEQSLPSGTTSPSTRATAIASEEDRSELADLLARFEVSDSVPEASLEQDRTTSTGRVGAQTSSESALSQNDLPPSSSVEERALNATTASRYPQVEGLPEVGTPAVKPDRLKAQVRSSASSTRNITSTRRDPANQATTNSNTGWGVSGHSTAALIPPFSIRVTERTQMTITENGRRLWQGPLSANQELRIQNPQNTRITVNNAGAVFAVRNGVSSSPLGQPGQRLTSSPMNFIF